MRPCRALAVFVLGAVLFTQSPGRDGAWAQGHVIDREIAKRHFEAGSALYAAGRYRDAIEEFEAASRVYPSSAFDYNIGRAFDRLDRPSDAIVAYRRYLAANPNGEQASDILARIETLEARLRPAPQTTDRDGKTPYLVPGLLLGVTLVTCSVGAALLGSAVRDFRALESTCGQDGSCARSAWDGIPPRDYAGKALLGISGALLVVDVALFAMKARQRVKVRRESSSTIRGAP